MSCTVAVIAAAGSAGLMVARRVNVEQLCHEARSAPEREPAAVSA
jgi:hypothetical protein